MVTVDFPCTQDQFNTLLEKVKSDQQDFTKFAITTEPGQTPLFGSVSTHDVDLAITFTGKLLTVQVTKFNSFLARHASDGVVTQHLTQIFNKFLSK
jgi:hypothetical protein